MTDRALQLVAEYTPAGDQPQAIAQLVEGLQNGLAKQTLLGVTGSGKSIGYDDPLLIEHRLNGTSVTRLVRAGEFIDSLMERAHLDTGSETERLACVEGEWSTHAYTPTSGTVERHRIGAFLRHRAPRKMFRVTTRC